MNLIFAEPWWLDAVAPGRWEEVRVARDNASARLVFMRQRHRTGIVRLTSPPLCPRLGPLVELPSDRPPSRQISSLKSIMTDLIAAMPPHDYYVQNCHPSFTYWLPFYWAGFKQTTQYSYVLDDLTDEESAWRAISSAQRREINKASEQYELRHDLDPRVLIDLMAATYSRQNLELDTEPEVIKRVHDAAVEREAGRQIVAVDRKGRPLAGAFVVWDDETVYYLLGGRADHDKPDAMPLVIWDAIRLAGKLAVRFDFEGSMIEGLERFFRSFGSLPEPYFQLTRASRRMEALVAARRLTELARGRP